MQTVSLFPQLFDYQMLGIFALRVTLGLVFVYFWYKKVTSPRAGELHFFERLGLRPAKIYFMLVSYSEGVAGTLLTLGLWTQGAALAGGALMTIFTFIKLRKPEALAKDPVELYIILAVASFALLFLGAGAFAIDLPL